MKIYQDANAATRYYYQCKLTDRQKMVCLDLHKDSSNTTVAETIIKNYYGDDLVSAELDLVQDIQSEEEVQNDN